jgi:hypothetical protein
MTWLPEVVLLLVAGVVLGPDGLGLLSRTVLEIVDPAVPVALVALGTIVGLHSSVQGRREKRLLAAATTEAAVTTAIVTAGLLLTSLVGGAIVLGGDGGMLPPLFVALALGICAAPSAAAAWHPPAGGVITERIGDLGALLPIALGGAALAWVRAPSATDALLLTLQACGVALVIAAAAWLLIGGAESDSEQRVFTVAFLLLLGGAAEYLSLSALLSGLIAGLFLERVGGPGRDAVSRHVLQFERPLIALVLLVVGARVDLPPAWIALGVMFLLLRMGAKLAAGRVAVRVAGVVAPERLGPALLSPGPLGLAFALNALHATGPDAAAVLAVAAIGTVGSELVAAVAQRREPA